MTKFEIRIVQDGALSDEGVWKDITDALRRDTIKDRNFRPPTPWPQTQKFLQRYAPEGFTVVEYRFEDHSPEPGPCPYHVSVHDLMGIRK